MLHEEILNFNLKGELIRSEFHRIAMELMQKLEIAVINYTLWMQRRASSTGNDVTNWVTRRILFANW